MRTSTVALLACFWASLVACRTAPAPALQVPAPPPLQAPGPEVDVSTMDRKLLLG